MVPATHNKDYKECIYTRSGEFMKNNTSTCVYLLALSMICCLAYVKPSYDWDILPYAAIVLQYDHTPGDLHRQVYNEAAREMPKDQYQLLAAANDRRKHWSADSSAFYSLLPFYVVKPFYTLLSWTFYRSGIPLIKAMVLPSVLAFFLSGLLLYTWLNRYLPGNLTCLICMTVMLLPNNWETARLSGPDFLAAFFMFFGMYFLLEKKSPPAFFISFLFAMGSRIDFILPLLVLMSLLFFQDPGRLKVSRKGLAAMALVALACYLSIAMMAAKYGWDPLFFPSFMKTLTANYAPSFNFRSYFRLMKDQLFTGLFYSQCAWIALLGICYFIIGKRDTNLMFEQKAVGALIVSAAIRFMMHPEIANRFYIGYELVIIALFIKKLAQLQKSEGLDTELPLNTVQ